MERCRKRLEDCPARLSREGCHLALHHIFWPENEYVRAGETAEEFRDLSINRTPMCKGEEMLLHKGSPPPMPSLQVMEHVVQTQKLRRELAGRPLKKA